MPSSPTPKPTPKWPAATPRLFPASPSSTLPSPKPSPPTSPPPPASTPSPTPSKPLPAPAATTPHAPSPNNRGNSSTPLAKKPSPTPKTTKPAPRCCWVPISPAAPSKTPCSARPRHRQPPHRRIQYHPRPSGRLDAPPRHPLQLQQRFQPLLRPQPRRLGPRRARHCSPPLGQDSH